MRSVLQNRTDRKRILVEAKQLKANRAIGKHYDCYSWEERRRGRPEEGPSSLDSFIVRVAGGTFYPFLGEWADRQIYKYDLEDERWLVPRQ